MKRRKRINTSAFFGFLAFMSLVTFLVSFLFENSGRIAFLSVSFLFGVMIPVFDFTENREPYGRLNPILYAAGALITFVFVDNYQGLLLLVISAIGSSLKELSEKLNINAETLLKDISERRYHVVQDNERTAVKADKIQVDSYLELFSGEIIPVDGVVISGTATATTTKLNGATTTFQIKIGDTVTSGTTVLSGNLLIRALSDFENSTVNGIVSNNAKVTKELTQHEKGILKIVSVITLAAFVAGLAGFLIASIVNKSPKLMAYGAIWVCFVCCADCYRGLLHNMYVNATLRCSNNGIVVKNKKLVEKSLFIKNLLFRKQGVLTSRQPVVSKVVPVEGVSESELLNYAAYAQFKASHAVSHELKSNYSKKVKKEEIYRFMETEDNGAMVQLTNGVEIMTGSAKVLSDFGVISGIISEEAVLCVAVNSVFVGHIVFEYEIKDEIKQYVDSLKYAGAKNLSIITRDSERATKSIALKSGIKRYFSELDSEGIENVVNKFGKNTVYVGYGKGDSYEFNKECAKLMFGGFLNDSKSTDGLLLSDGLSCILKFFNIVKDTRILGFENLLLAVLNTVILVSFAVSGSNAVVAGGLLVVIFNVLSALNGYRMYKKL